MTTIYAGTQGFSLTYYTTDGIWSDSHYLNPAVSGVDYQGISEDSPQTLYFPVGNSSQTITVPTMLANVNDDYDRAFTLMFSGDTFDAHTVGVLLPVYGTVTVRPDANGDGVFDTTDDFLNAIAPAPICVEGQGPRTMVQLTESVYVPSGSSGVTGNFLAVLPYVTGLDFWTSPEGENQLTPDENGNIICDSFSTQYTRTIWVSIDPSGTFTGDPITLDLDAASNNQQTEMVALPAASPGVAAVTPDADPAKPGPTQAGWAAAVQPAQQQTYTLTGRIVGQKAGLWGNFSFGIKWNISPAAIKVAGRPANGWIIQHIQVTYDVRGRSARPNPRPPARQHAQPVGRRKVELLGGMEGDRRARGAGRRPTRRHFLQLAPAGERQVSSPVHQRAYCVLGHGAVLPELHAAAGDVHTE